MSTEKVMALMRASVESGGELMRKARPETAVAVAKKGRAEEEILLSTCRECALKADWLA